MALFNKNHLGFLIFTILLSCSWPALAGKDEHGHSHEEAIEHHDEHGHAHEEEGDEHGHDHTEAHTDQTIISEPAAKVAGIATATAGPAKIDETVSLTGRIALNQNKAAVVKARFHGVVREVRKTQGEMVRAGDVLAAVESNESLRTYNVTAPIDGIILTRNTNIGDVVGDSPMFTIADISELWAELHVFPQDLDRVKNGMPVILSSTECPDLQKSQIISTLPIVEASTQTLLARATVKNLDNHWAPGMSVRGDVVISSREVPVAVKTAAIQRMEGQQVVFVKEGDTYLKRTVKTGTASPDWTEVLGGLKAGEEYVSEGGFTVKADIGKAGAEHEH